MADKRPKNLNLFTIRFPITAIASILHRLSGFILFLFIPLLLWGLSESLGSPDHFNEFHAFLTQPLSKFFAWVMLSVFAYHFVAGIKHLLMDMHIGDTLKGGRLAAYLALAISGLLIVSLGVWLW